VLGWVSYTQLTHTTKKIIIDEMYDSAEQIKSQYNLNIKTAISNIDLFSNHSTVLQYALTNDADTRYSLMQLPLMKQFSRYNHSFPGYFEFRFIFPDGSEDTRWTKEYSLNKNENESSNENFIQMSSQENEIYYSFYKNSDTGLPSLWISKRIKIRDKSLESISIKAKLRGYFVISSNLDFLKKQLNSIKIGSMGYFIITNEHGELLAAPDDKTKNIFTQGEYIKINLKGTNWKNLKQSSQPIKISLENSQNYLVNSQIIDKNLYLVAVLPESELFSGSKNITSAVILITVLSIIISTSLIAFVLSFILIKPINILNKATTDISLGKLDSNIEIKSDDEIGELAKSFNEMALHIKESNDQIKFLAYHDNLTGLPNRLMFKEYLEPVLARAKRHNEIFAILFLDLDDFKRVNDSLGHKAGDKLLQTIAIKLTKSVRDEDFISHGEKNNDNASNIIARLGGDEFLILLTNLNQPYAASIVAERILIELKKPEVIENNELYISTSIGISIYPDDGDTSETLIKNADLAMYHAKDSGKNIFRNYSASLNETAKTRLNMENRLRKAVDNGDFILHYQPQVNPATNKLHGVEALIRWNDPEHGMIPPNDFIYLAEENGLILQITDWVMYESCRQNKAWQDAGLPNIVVSTNISGIDIARRDIYTLIQQVIDTTKLSPEYLEIELTESVMMSSDLDVVGLLRKISESGISIALDDFGTGYSSLNYLLRFPIQTLKIDRSFIIDIEHNKTKSSITSSIINMAHTLDLKVVAEGIEKEEQLNILKRYNCDIIQGYYFSKPVEHQVIESMLTNEKLADDKADKISDG